MIGCAFTVLNTLGAGFLEKVNENALAYEVCAAGLSAVQQYGKRGLMAAYQSAYKMWDRSRRHSEDRQVSIKE